jgi:hypothetical protein
MAVVINEFEVVPAESRPREAEPPTAEQSASSSKPPKDAERELERLLRKQRARAARLMAV